MAEAPRARSVLTLAIRSAQPGVDDPVVTVAEQDLGGGSA